MIKIQIRDQDKETFSQTSKVKINREVQEDNPKLPFRNKKILNYLLKEKQNQIQIYSK